MNSNGETCAAHIVIVMITSTTAAAAATTTTDTMPSIGQGDLARTSLEVETFEIHDSDSIIVLVSFWTESSSAEPVLVSLLNLELCSEAWSSLSPEPTYLSQNRRLRRKMER